MLTRPAWRSLLLFLAALLLPLAAPAQRAASFHERVKKFVAHDAPSIRIDNVRVVDGTGAPAREGQSILVRDGRIARLGSAEALDGEPAATVIDGRGRTVLPGLVMMHEHLVFLDPLADAPSYASEPFASPKLYLAHGATTIRTAGTVSGIEDLRVASQIRDGQFVGPDIRVTAPFLEGPGSFAYQLMPITDPDRARRIVRFWADEGASSFKFYMNVSRDVFKAAVGEAHQRGIQVTGHLCSITFREAAEMGIDNLEHGIAVASDFVKDKEPDRCPPGRKSEEALLAADPGGPEMKAVIDTLVRHHVAVTSTLAVFAAGVVDWFPSQDDLGLLNAQSQAWALRWLAFRQVPARREALRKLLDAEMRFERAFVSAGGMLLAGTDPTGWGGTLPGRGNHATLRLMVEAGFTPLEAIHFATQNGARFQKIDDRVGTIAEGKQADLVLVDGKPDQDISDLVKVDLVFRDGIAYDAKKLTADVRGKVGR
jgi:imidazolonepropionase-like amidohydrolase